MKNNEVKAMAIAAAVAVPAAVFANPSAVFADTFEQTDESSAEMEHISEEEDELDACADELEAAASDLEEAAQEKEAAEADYDAAKTEMEEADASLEQAESDAKAAFREAADAVQAEAEQAEAQVRDAEKEREEAGKELENAEADVAAAVEEKNRTEEDLQIAELEAEEILREDTSTEDIQADDTKADDAQPGDSQNKENSVEDTRAEDSVKEEDSDFALTDRLQERVQESDLAAEEARKALAQAETDLADFDAQNDYADYHEAITEAETEKTDADAAYEQAQKKLEEKQQELDQTESKLEEVKANAADAVEVTEEEIQTAREDAEHADRIRKIREEELALADAVIGTLQMQSGNSNTGGAASTYAISIPGVDSSDVKITVCEFDQMGGMRNYIGYENGTFYIKYQMYVNGRNYGTAKSYEDAQTWYAMRVQNGAFTGEETFTVKANSGTLHYQAEWTDAEGNAQSQIYRITVEEAEQVDGSGTQNKTELACQNIVDTIITADMSDYQKLDTIVKYVAETYGYDARYNNAAGMLENGGGSCWASTDFIQRLGRLAGLEVQVRNGNRDALAGSGHINNIVEIDGVLYIADAGYVEAVPRYYSIRKSDGFTRYAISGGGALLRQYEGKDEDVHIPDGVTKIEANIFSGGGYSVDYKNIYIPSSVVYIGKMTSGLWTLENVHVDEANEEYCSIDGSLYSKDGKTLYFVPKGKSYVVIPDTVETIADDSLFYSASASAGTRVIVGAKGSAAETFVEKYNTSASKGYELVFVDSTDLDYARNLKKALQESEEITASQKMNQWKQLARNLSTDAFSERAAQIRQNYAEALTNYENAAEYAASLTADSQDYRTQISVLESSYQSLLTEKQVLEDAQKAAGERAETAAQNLERLLSLQARQEEKNEAQAEERASLLRQTEAAGQAYDAALAKKTELQRISDQLLTAQENYENAVASLSLAEQTQADAAGRLAQAEADELQANTILENARAKLEQVSGISYDGALEKAITDPDYVYLNSYIDEVKAATVQYEQAQTTLAEAERVWKEKTSRYQSEYAHYQTAKAAYDLQEAIRKAAENPDNAEIIYVPTVPTVPDAPTTDPTVDLIDNRTADPTDDPAVAPIDDRTNDPTADPAVAPIDDRTNDPTADPTVDPIDSRTADLTVDPLDGNDSGRSADPKPAIPEGKTTEFSAAQENHPEDAQSDGQAYATSTTAQGGSQAYATSTTAQSDSQAYATSTTAQSDSQAYTTSTDSVATGDNSRIPALAAEMLLAGGALYIIRRKRKMIK